MDIQERALDRRLLLEFSGELDHHGARNALRRIDLALDAALPRTLVLDFGGVTFMDSSGIALILRARNRMELLEGTVQLRNIPPQARRVLDAAGIGNLLSIRQEGENRESEGEENNPAQRERRSPQVGTHSEQEERGPAGGKGSPAGGGGSPAREKKNAVRQESGFPVHSGNGRESRGPRVRRDGNRETAQERIRTPEQGWTPEQGRKRK